MTAQQSVVRCKQSFTLAAGAAQPPPSITPPPLSVNSLIVAAAETAARVRTNPYLSVHIRTPSRGKQAFAKDILSQGVHLWCGSCRTGLPADWCGVRIGTDVYGGGGDCTTGGGAVRAKSGRGG